MENLIKITLKLAQKSKRTNDFPVAAIIYKENKIISKAYNKRNKSQITTDHAEIIAINKANKKLKTWRLNGYSMIVTLEPCEMCKTIIKESRLDNVYYLIKRYEYKKMCKNTKFKKIDYYDNAVENYKMSIQCFFDDKR